MNPADYKLDILSVKYKRKAIKNAYIKKSLLLIENSIIDETQKLNNSTIRSLSPLRSAPSLTTYKASNACVIGGRFTSPPKVEVSSL